jgi:3D (Asp-Asp-Asp) domain-containing protein
VLLKGRVSAWEDDLDTGTGLSGAIGRNWSLNLSGSGSGAAIASETQHPGIYRLTTGATSTSVAGLYNTAGPYLNDIKECEFIFRIGSVLTTVQSGVFLADTSALTGNVIGIIFWSATDATNWLTYKTVAGVTTTASFGKAAVVSEWWRAFFKRTGSGAFDLTIERMSDNTTATVGVSGLTLTAYTNFQFRCVNLAAVSRTMDPDYFRINSEVLLRN